MIGIVCILAHSNVREYVLELWSERCEDTMGFFEIRTYTFFFWRSQ